MKFLLWGLVFICIAVFWTRFKKCERVVKIRQDKFRCATEAAGSVAEDFAAAVEGVGRSVDASLKSLTRLNVEKGT